MGHAVVGAESRGSLAGLRPGGLAGRLVLSAVDVGAIGSSVMVGLAVLFEVLDATPAGRVLAIALPVALAAMLGRRIAAVAGWARSGPSGRVLLVVSGAGLLLRAMAQGWPLIAGERVELWRIPLMALGVVFYGGQFGVGAALLASAVVVPGVLLVRLVGVRVGLSALKIALTVVAVATTTGMLSMVVSDLGASRVDAWPVVATVVGVVGVCGILAAEWAVEGR